MKCSLSNNPEEKLLVGEDLENPNGNFSDIFVCHGELVADCASLLTYTHWSHVFALSVIC